MNCPHREKRMKQPQRRHSAERRESNAGTIPCADRDVADQRDGPEQLRENRFRPGAEQQHGEIGDELGGDDGEDENEHGRGLIAPHRREAKVLQAPKR